MHDYVIWQVKDEPNACSLYELSGYDDVWKLFEGDSVLDDFPSDVTYEMDPDLPKDMVVTDSLLNNLDLVIVTKRVKDFLSSQVKDNVEYLPIYIINHKGRKLPEPVYIVHPLTTVDCLDEKASGAERGIIDEDAIDSVEKIVLIPSKVDTNRQLFRLTHFGDVLLVRRDLAQQLTENNFTGIGWCELKKYSS